MTKREAQVFNDTQKPRKKNSVQFATLGAQWSELVHEYPESNIGLYGLSKALCYEGNVYFWRRKYKLAQTAYTNCLKAAERTLSLQKSWQVYYLCAHARLNLGKIHESDLKKSEKFFEDAIQEADRGLAINKHPWLYHQKGFALVYLGQQKIKLGDFKSASASLQESIHVLKTALDLTKMYTTSNETKCRCHQMIAVAYEKMSEINLEDSDQPSENIKNSLTEANYALALNPDYIPAKRIKKTALAALTKLDSPVNSR